MIPTQDYLGSRESDQPGIVGIVVKNVVITHESLSTTGENIDAKLRMKSSGRENMDTKRPEYDKILVHKIT